MENDQEQEVRHTTLLSNLESGAGFFLTATY